MQTITSEAQGSDFLKKLYQAKPEVVGIGFLADHWASAGAQKKKAKKSGGQLALVFDDGDAAITEEGSESEGKEYAFYGMSVSYQEGEQVHTGCMMAGELLKTEWIVNSLRELVRKITHIAVIGWKDMLHHTTPLSGDSGSVPQQEGFPAESVEEQETLFGKLADLEIAAYLLNPLKDTYQADDIARDYLDMTIASYAELFDRKTVSQILEDDAISEESVLQYLGTASSLYLVLRLRNSSGSRIDSEICGSFIRRLRSQRHIICIRWNEEASVQTARCSRRCRHSFRLRLRHWSRRFMIWQGRNLILIRQSSLA